MTRTLMASTAVLALITTGALAQQPADQQQPMDQQPQATQPMQPDAQAQQPMAQEGQILADDLIGEAVYSSRTAEEEHIGDINDLVLDAGGAINAAIVGIGGFLGIGQHEVAIPFDQIEFATDPDDPERLRLFVAATREELEAMPAFEETDTATRFRDRPAEERQGMFVERREPGVTEAPADQQVAEPADPAAPAEPGVAEAPTADLMMDQAQVDVEWIDEEHVRFTFTMDRQHLEMAPGIEDFAAIEPEAEPEVAEAPEAEPEPEVAEAPEAEPEVAEPTPDMPGEVEVTWLDDQQFQLIVTLSRQELQFEPDVAMTEPAEPEVAEPAEPAEPTPEVAEAPDAEPEPEVAEAPEEREAREARFLEEAEMDELRATHWLEAEVITEDGEDLGTVSDLLMDERGNAHAILIDVGGFLGIDTREVAIEIEQAQVERVEEDHLRIHVAMTREQLEEAPEFERDVAITEPAEPEVAERPEEPEVAERPEEPEVAERPEVVEERPVEREAAPIPEAAEPADPTMAPRADLTADRLMGAPVMDQQGEEIGHVDDVIFTQDGQVRAIVTDIGGFLGIGAHTVAVDFETVDIQVDQDGNLMLTVAATREQLEAAPEYRAAEWEGEPREPAATEPAEEPERQPAQ